jgi:hypothetical protein
VLPHAQRSMWVRLDSHPISHSLVWLLRRLKGSCEFFHNIPRPGSYFSLYMIGYSLVSLRGTLVSNSESLLAWLTCLWDIYLIFIY